MLSTSYSWNYIVQMSWWWWWWCCNLNRDSSTTVPIYLTCSGFFYLIFSTPFSHLWRRLARGFLAMPFCRLANCNFLNKITIFWWILIANVYDHIHVAVEQLNLDWFSGIFRSDFKPNHSLSSVVRIKSFSCASQNEHYYTVHCLISIEYGS